MYRLDRIHEWGSKTQEFQAIQLPISRPIYGACRNPLLHRFLYIQCWWPLFSHFNHCGRIRPQKTFNSLILHGHRRVNCKCHVQFRLQKPWIWREAVDWLWHSTFLTTMYAARSEYWGYLQPCLCSLNG